MPSFCPNPPGVRADAASGPVQRDATKFAQVCHQARPAERFSETSLNENERLGPTSYERSVNLHRASHTTSTTLWPQYWVERNCFVVRSMIKPWCEILTSFKQPQKTQLPWNPAKPWDGLGFRSVQANGAGAAPRMRELPVG